MPISTIAASFKAETFLEYARSIGWQVDSVSLRPLEGRQLGSRIQELHTQVMPAMRERIHQDFEKIELLAKEKSRTAISDAVGPNPEVHATLEALKTDRNRALWLLTNHRDTLFERALHATLFSSQAGSPRKWSGYLLADFSRDWSLESVDVASIERLVARIVEERERVRRKIKVEPFARPATRSGWNGPLQFQFSVSISDRETDSEEWVGDDLQTRPRIGNRRMEIVVSPSAKTLECVVDEIDRELFFAVTNGFAREILKQTADLEPFKHRKYRLAHLNRRPTFECQPEHRIAAVKVTKLVVLAGVGTATYWASSRSQRDAYDAAAGATGKPGDKAIGRRPIIAAAFRVEFEPRTEGKRGRVVSFEITLPHKCDLRERTEAERLVVQTYLRD